MDADVFICIIYTKDIKPSLVWAQLSWHCCPPLPKTETLAVHPRIPMPRQELLRVTVLLSLYFAASPFRSRQGWIQRAGPPLEGRRDQILPLWASKSSRSWGAGEQKVTEFWRGRFCSQREEEHLCSAQPRHFLGLLESCGQPGLFIFNEAIHVWVTGKVWSCPWVTPLVLEMGLFHLG